MTWGKAKAENWSKDDTDLPIIFIITCTYPSKYYTVYILFRYSILLNYFWVGIFMMSEKQNQISLQNAMILYHYYWYILQAERWSQSSSQFKIHFKGAYWYCIITFITIVTIMRFMHVSDAYSVVFSLIQSGFV